MLGLRCPPPALGALCGLALSIGPVVAHAQLEPEPDETRPLLRHELDLEYRVQHVAMRPLSLNDLSAARVGWFDQRGRVGVRVGIGEHVSVKLLTDVLDGVVFGDNGSFVTAPRRNRGALAATKFPNLSTFEIGQLDPNGSTLDFANFGFRTVPADVLKVRQLYGEATLPIGLIRVGRQPLTTGRNVLVHEGTRINRWGISRQPDVLDAIAFGTKLSAIWDALLGRAIDKDPNRGLFAGLMVGQLVEQNPALEDDLLQLAGTIFYKGRHQFVFGLELDRVDAGFVGTHRFADEYETSLSGLGGYLILQAGDFFFSAFHSHLLGGTREISEGLAALGTTSGPPTRQDISAYGGFVELAWRLEPMMFVFELFYATGDDTPKSSDPINQFTFAEDTNVGLHLFENVVHYASARSAALGVANLDALGVRTYPAAEISTRGSLQNAIVLFPQVEAHPWPWLSARAGVMFAFAEKPSVDPIRTIIGATGETLDDDLVNFAGGRPGNYWGTEIDVGLTLRPVEGILIDLEGAYLIPGDALQDENGDAVNSIYGNLRFTFTYGNP